MFVGVLFYGGEDDIPDGDVLRHGESQGLPIREIDEQLDVLRRPRCVSHRKGKKALYVGRRVGGRGLADKQTLERR